MKSLIIIALILVASQSFAAGPVERINPYKDTNLVDYDDNVFNIAGAMIVGIPTQIKKATEPFCEHEDRIRYRDCNDEDEVLKSTSVVQIIVEIYKNKYEQRRYKRFGDDDAEPIYDERFNFPVSDFTPETLTEIQALNKFTINPVKALKMKERMQALMDRLFIMTKERVVKKEKIIVQEDCSDQDDPLRAFCDDTPYEKNVTTAFRKLKLSRN